ncbi:MAG: asparagine--tRNA ligase [Deltaproteobacteria bacterium]|nr:asparagine--tRNA ligase [Deltaproteobacteria bacterium]
MKSEFPAPRIRWILESGEVDARYTVRGWVRTRRGSKNVHFVALNDGSTPAALQVVVPAELPGLEELLPQIATGASLEVDGLLVESPGSGQRVELRAEAVRVLGAADPETYPLQKKGHSFEFLRSIAHLRPRSNSFGAVFRIRSTLAQATHRFFGDRGFNYIQTPIITASDCEGAGAMFEVHTRDPEPFFGRPAMLTVSGQLNAEALAYGLGLVYTFGPTFRAENSNTSRHLSEFWMIEPEMAFHDIHDDMDLAEAYLKALLDAVFERNAADLELLQRFVEPTLIETLSNTRDNVFERITYTEAIEILERSGRAFEFPVSWGADLQSEHERFLTETHFKKPVMVTGYPKGIKAFYMFQNDDDRTVAALDVLVPRIGEIIGGSQREHRLDRLTARLLADGMQLEDYEWYLDLHRYGAVPHAGFGLGFERAVMFCTGMANIRDVIPFPRAPGQAAF